MRLIDEVKEMDHSRRWVIHGENKVSLLAVVGLHELKGIVVNLPKLSLWCHLMVSAGHQSKDVEK
jgi:hypothetical protein